MPGATRPSVKVLFNINWDMRRGCCIREWLTLPRQCGADNVTVWNRKKVKIIQKHNQETAPGTLEASQTDTHAASVIRLYPSKGNIRLSARSHPCKRQPAMKCWIISRHGVGFSPASGGLSALTLWRCKVRGSVACRSHCTEKPPRSFSAVSQAAPDRGGLNNLSGLILDPAIVFSLTAWRRDIVFRDKKHYGFLLFLTWFSY